MGNLFEGNRVVDFALGTLITHDGYLNPIQDQLKAMLKALRVDHTTAGGNMSVTAGDDWDFVTPGGGQWFWEAVVTNSVNLIVPVNLRIGQKITEVGCTVSGSATSTGGSCTFYYGDPFAGLSTIDLDGVANAFNTGGVGTTTDYTSTAAPLPLTVSEDGSNRPYVYFFRFLSGSNSSTDDCRVWRVWTETQFGS